MAQPQQPGQLTGANRSNGQRGSQVDFSSLASTLLLCGSKFSVFLNHITPFRPGLHTIPGTSYLSRMEPCVRWHRSDCSNPSITLDGDIPRCLGCDANSSDLVSRLIAHHHAQAAGIHLPAEAPLGQANFWWPPSVPYYRSQAGNGTDSDPSAGEEAGTELSTQDSSPSSYSPSPIYPSSLDSSHFRLIYLTESEDISAPIHIQLEEYSFTDHPEYETVSYVWGGEEGDSTPCKPVYVGRYWDVILTTKNCSTLLYYLRPQKLCRVIWLDAICINQADNVEKPAQISRMGDIYASCERVVAYLGDDLVTRPSGKTFRPRIDFRKPMETSAEFIVACAESAGLNEDQLFERRYLTRIWIVQELLLSTEAMFPLGDLDILCNQGEAMDLVLRGDREQPDISATGGRSLSHLLMATSHCHASDPRDRVYGVLGLYKPQDNSQRLVPDYSISWRDCWLGTAAYIPLVEKNLQPLTRCVGTNRPWHLPSWVPDIEDASSWIVDNGQRNLDAYKYDLWDVCSDPCRRELQESTTAFGNSMTQFVMYSRDTQDLRPYSVIPSHWWLQLNHRLVHSGALSTMSFESPMIDSSNGAFQIGVLRIFNKPCQLELESEGDDGIASLWAFGPSTAAHFRVMGMQEPIALDESYHLFLISCCKLDSEPDAIEWRIPSSQDVLLALAPADLEEDISFVSLHGCYLLQYVDFRSMDHFGDLRAGVYRDTNSLHSLHWVLHNLQQAVINNWEAESSCDWIFSWMFPSPKVRARDILPLLIRLTEPKLCSDEQSAFNHSLSATAKSLCPDFDPVIQGDYFHLTIKNKSMAHALLWMRFFSRFYETEFVADIGQEVSEQMTEPLEVNYTYPIVQDGEGWTKLRWFNLDMDIVQWNNRWDGIDYPITVRIRLRFLLSRIKRTTPYTAMLYAREFAKLLDEDLETFLSRTPRPEDRHVFFEAWGPSLVEELGLVWKPERITIV